jgi:hypothetical protein
LKLINSLPTKLLGNPEPDLAFQEPFIVDENGTAIDRSNRAGRMIKQKNVNAEFEQDEELQGQH